MADVVKKGQRRRVGDVVKVEIGDGVHCYGRVLADADFAFYDSRSRVEIPLKEISGRPVLFFAAVMRYAVTTGRWKVVGNVALEGESLKAPPTFIQDALHPTRFEIYEGGQIRKSTREECAGLERTAVWDPEHIGDRLRDHYAGRKNVWLESLKMT
jgi:hypothetical protein